VFEHATMSFTLAVACCQKAFNKLPHLSKEKKNSRQIFAESSMVQQQNLRKK